jgi:hypothetical protein
MASMALVQQDVGQSRQMQCTALWAPAMQSGHADARNRSRQNTVTVVFKLPCSGKDISMECLEAIAADHQYHKGLSLLNFD